MAKNKTCFDLTDQRKIQNLISFLKSWGKLQLFGPTLPIRGQPPKIGGKLEIGKCSKDTLDTFLKARLKLFYFASIHPQYLRAR